MDRLKSFDFLLQNSSNVTGDGYNLVLKSLAERTKLEKIGLSFFSIFKIDDSSMELAAQVLSSFTEIKDFTFVITGKNNISIPGMLSISKAIPKMSKLERIRFAFTQPLGLNTLFNFFRRTSNPI